MTAAGRTEVAVVEEEEELEEKELEEEELGEEDGEDKNVLGVFLGTM